MPTYVKTLLHSFPCQQYMRKIQWGDRSVKAGRAVTKYSCSGHKTEAFQRVDSEGAFELGYDSQYWWETSGKSLAVLLDKAGYSLQAQYQLLKFVRAITPSLGAARTPGRRFWKSFMTDDHNPLELSWDWRTGDTKPKIRFSIEPVGLWAGTSVDPDNELAASRFQEVLIRLLPTTHVELLDYFQQELNGKEARGSVEGHCSKQFYAFDLGSHEIMSKTYFFPGFKARATQQSNFDVILQTLQMAPGSTPDGLRALETFREYVQDPSSPPLEMDMLAIDLVEPSKSRFKIYFRIRDTSFKSMKHTMTLGNRLQKPELERGLREVRRFYYALLGRNVAEDAAQEDVQLPVGDHRTAGMLYNVEFKYGSKSPKVKAYLPVRHYVQSEAAVMVALKGCLCTTDDALTKSNVANYSQAMESIFSREALMSQNGLHTYIGCSVEADAKLRLVSYINPRQLAA